MLIGSGVRAGGGPMRYVGGVGAHALERGCAESPGKMLNFHAGEATVVGGASQSNRNGRPSGYLHPRSWAMPIKGGGMASRNLITGTGEITATAQAGYPMAAALTGSGDVSADLTGAFLAAATLTGSGALVVVLTADALASAALTGTGTVTASASAAAALSAALTGSGSLSASASAAASLSAALTGSGVLTASAIGAAPIASTITGSGSLSATAIGAFLASADLTGTGALAVTMTAEGSMVAGLTGSGAITAFLGALGNMQADVGATGDAELTPDAIAAAVWAHGSAISLIAAVDLIRQISDNRLEVDIDGQRLVLYDDDGTTELREWPLATDGGELVTTATGVQTKRGVPT